MNSDFQPRSTEGRSSEDIIFHPEKKASGNRNNFNRGLRQPETDKEERFTSQYSDYYYKNKDGNFNKKDKNVLNPGYNETNVKSSNIYGDHNYRDYKPKHSYNQRRNNKSGSSQDSQNIFENSNQQDLSSTNTGYFAKANHFRNNNPNQYTRTGHIYHKQTKGYPYQQHSSLNTSTNPTTPLNRVENSKLDSLQNEQFFNKQNQFLDRQQQAISNSNPAPINREINSNIQQNPINQDWQKTQNFTKDQLSPSTEESAKATNFLNNSNVKAQAGNECILEDQYNSVLSFKNNESINNQPISKSTPLQIQQNQIEGPIYSNFQTESESDNSSPIDYSNSEITSNYGSVIENFEQLHIGETKSQTLKYEIECKESINSSPKIVNDNIGSESSNSSNDNVNTQPSTQFSPLNNEKPILTTINSNKDSEKSQTSNILEIQSPSTSVSNVTELSVSSTPSNPENSKPSGSWKASRLGSLSRPENLDRQTKSLLNKLTIEKFPIILEQLSFLEESLKDETEMQNFVNHVVGKAISEPEWSEMYADLCLILFWRSPSFNSTNLNAFRLALISKIENEFLALPKTLDLPEEKKKVLDPHSIELEIKKLRNHILGVITLIGELYQRKLLAYKVLHQVVLDLVINTETPHEHIIECFLQLICTTGYYIDQNESIRKVLDLWFGRLKELHSRDVYSKRLKYVIQNVLDLRKSNWLRKIHKDKAKGLSEMRGQLEKEDYVGGATHAASYGNIVTVGKPINASTNDHYATYLREQEERFILKRQHLLKAKPTGPHH